MVILQLSAWPADQAMRALHRGHFVDPSGNPIILSGDCMHDI